MSSQNYESHSKYTLGITELYWNKRHGEYNVNEFINEDEYYKSIHGYIFMQGICPTQFIQNYKKYGKRVLKFYYENIRESYLTNGNAKHNIIDNFEKIISDKKNYKIDIVEKIQLEGHFAPTIAIIKTHYLRLIQRKWKSIFKKRNEIMKKRMNIRSLKYKEINGSWPKDCIHLPTISNH